jgi:membrane-associated phospholipid phosphatase
VPTLTARIDESAVAHLQLTAAANERHRSRAAVHHRIRNLISAILVAPFYRAFTPHASNPRRDFRVQRNGAGERQPAAELPMTDHHARVIWPLIAVMALLTAASFALAGLRLDFASNPYVFVAVALLFAISWFYSSLRPNARLKILTASAGQMLLILLFGILLTYAAVTAKFPYVDANLYAIDNALGFDRHAYLSFFGHRPWLEQTLGLAYFSMLPQFAALPLIMFVADDLERLQRMIVAVAVALVITAFVSVFTPSLTAFVFVDLPHLAHVPADLYTPAPTMEALRAGTFHAVRLDNLEGLVSFPSFHTTAALIFIWTLRRVPYLMWPALALNLALIAATPIDGAHYFIDVAGGAVVAAIAVGATYWLCRRRPHQLAALTGAPLANNALAPR